MKYRLIKAIILMNEFLEYKMMIQKKRITNNQSKNRSNRQSSFQEEDGLESSNRVSHFIYQSDNTQFYYLIKINY